ncbi:MAG TPA: cation:proton antiporter [bacterium]
MDLTLLKEIIIIFAISIFVLLIFHKFKVPTMVGLLFTGVLAGPHGLGLIKAAHQVELLAEIGVIFLLFTIGIHFSIKELGQLKRAALVGGTAQMILTIAVVAFCAQKFGRPPREAIFLGCLLALSSTAIVLKLLEERAEMDTPQGRNAIAVLIFQDIIIFPIILFMPILAGQTQNFTETFLLLLLKAVVMVALVFISSQWIVPKILFQVVKTRSRELFALSVVMICFAVAWLTSHIGLSLSLGAFLAGLIISESEYSHQALGNILPFQYLFLSLFFVSIGMLLDVHVVFDRPIFILTLFLAIITIKTLTAALAGLILGFPLRTSIMLGLMISQIGEFSFILSKIGLSFQLLPAEDYQLFLSVSLISMSATPFLIASSGRIGDFFMRLPLPSRIKNGFYRVNELPTELKIEALKDHLIIIGFGINGRNVTLAAAAAGIPYIIIEMNPETVRVERANGEPIFFGDAGEESVLRHAGIENARVAVVAISDAAATRKVTEMCRRLNRSVHIVARTRYVQEMWPLYEIGADEVIPEEFETSIEIFTRVLRHYLVPRDRIEALSAQIRSDSYEMLRSRTSAALVVGDFKIPELEVCNLKIAPDSRLAGRTLLELRLRQNYDVNVLGIFRGGAFTSNPHGGDQLHGDDNILVMGKPEKIVELAEVATPKPLTATP